MSTNKDYRVILESSSLQRRDREQHIIQEILAWLTVVGIALAVLVNCRPDG